MIPLVYSAVYNMPSLGSQGLRFQKTLEHLQTLVSVTLVTPEPADVSHTHDPAYLNSLQNPEILRTLFELEAGEGDVLEIRTAQEAQYAGSLTATRLALKHGAAIHLGGGMHHASRAEGGGFCLYNDITASVEWLLKSNAAKRVLIVDLDAHQGNGYEKDLEEACKAGQVCILDAYAPLLFPYPTAEKEREMIHYYIPYEKGDRGNQFMPLLAEALPLPFQEFGPDFVIYVAGTDTLEGDPLTGLGQSKEAIQDRDAMVFQVAKHYGVPVMMCMSGGYGAEVPKVVAESVARILTSFA